MDADVTDLDQKISNRARTGDGSPDRTVDRVILSLFACVLFLTVLFLVAALPGPRVSGPASRIVRLARASSLARR